jgi:mRNA interferase MazF
MAIHFHPAPGMVLMCDFRGSVAPEIWKARPVVIISSNEFHRVGLSTIVPLSTKRPTAVTPCHVRLLNPPFPFAAAENWAKCDLVMSVSHRRLDRVRLGPGSFVIGWVTPRELRMIRLAAACSFGVELLGRRK